MNEKTLVLIVDDDERILQLLSLYLSKRGYAVITSTNGLAAIAMLQDKRPNLVLLDVMLPGMSGWQALEEIRSKSDVPVIMLTAKGDTSDRVHGLDCGADDYVVKPFDLKELLARIKVVLRRTAFSDKSEGRSLSIGSLDINIDNYYVSRMGKKIDMPPKEMELLYFFASHPNKVFTREQLLDAVWGFDFCGDSRTVDVHIKRLRSKLGENEEWNIRTIWSVGYKFERIIN